MPNFNNWTATDAIDPVPRAVDAWRRISDKPTSLTLKRSSSTLPAQTVRVEFDNAQNSETKGGTGFSSQRAVVVFGVRGHPTVANTDIQRGDLFALNGYKFRVLEVIYQLGEVQATCEAQA